MAAFHTIVQADDLRQNLFVEQLLVLVVALMLQPSRTFFFNSSERGRVADVFCEIIIQLRQFLVLIPSTSTA